MSTITVVDTPPQTIVIGGGGVILAQTGGTGGGPDIDTTTFALVPKKVLTTPYNVLLTDTLLLVNPPSTTQIVMTMPSAAGFTGMIIIIFVSPDPAKSALIKAAVGQNVGGAASIQLGAPGSELQYRSVSLVSDGTSSWWIA